MKALPPGADYGPTYRLVTHQNLPDLVTVHKIQGDPDYVVNTLYQRGVLVQLEDGCLYEVRYAKS